MNSTQPVRVRSCPSCSAPPAASWHEVFELQIARITTILLRTHVLFLFDLLQDGVGVDERRLCRGDAGVGQGSESALADFEGPCARRSLDDGDQKVTSAYV